MTNKLKTFMIAYALFFLCLLAPHAQATVDVELRYFEDKTASMTADEIAAKADSLDWKPAQHQHVQFGFTRSRVWIHFRLAESKMKYGEHDPLFLVVPNEFLQKVGFFSAIDGKIFRRSFAGPEVPLSERDPGVLRTAATTFRISSPRLPATDYFLSAESRLPVTVSVRLMEAPEFAYRHWTHLFFLGIFFGGLFLAFAFNLFLATSLRSSAYLNYCLFIAFISLGFFSIEGLTTQLLWGEWAWWALRELQVFNAFAVLFYVRFLREFLESKRIAPKLDFALVLLTGISLLRGAWALFSLWEPIIIIGWVTVMGINFGALALALIAVQKKVRSAGFVLLAALCFNLSVLLFQLQESNLIWLGNFAGTLPHWGIALETTLLCFALADRIRHVNLELSLQKVAMVHAEKMSALGRMAGEIAHEINNPLAIMHGNAVLIAKLETSNHQVRDFAQVIEKTAHRVSKMVKGMRGLARDSRLDPLEPVALACVLQDAVSLFEDRARQEQIKIVLPEHDLQFSILCRSSDICQVLVNLLTNSFDAVAECKDPIVKIEVNKKSEVVEIAVVDNGRGIPKRIRSQIQEPFFTTKEAGKGLGLGLSISNAIVDAHGGKLWLDEAAKFTRFAFSIPLAPASSNNSKLKEKYNYQSNESSPEIQL